MSSLPETLVQFRTDLEEAIGREHAARLRTRGRRQRILVLATAALIVVVGTASAFGTVRDFLFGSGGSAFSSPRWSPDGRITFVRHRWDNRGAVSTEVYVMNADGSGQRNLTQEWGLDADIFPIWSPDGRKVAFESNPCTAPGACAGIAQIYVMNADGSGLRRVARGGKVRRIYTGQGVCPCSPPPTWSPDGRKIAFGSERGGNVDVYVMKADGTGQRRLTRSRDGEKSLAWSPDGRKIAFVNKRNGNDDVFIINADGSGQRNLTAARGNDRAPVWSPDGRKIAFRSDRDGNGELYVVNADGSGLRRLTRNPASDGGPVWSPDGRKIAFVRFRSGYRSDVFVMNVDGSGQRNLTRTGAAPRNADDDSPAWSPDGRKIIFVSERDGNGQIYVMNADGSGQRRLTGPKGSP